MRKITVSVKLKLLIYADEGVEMTHILDELDYRFKDTTGQASVIDSEVLDFEVIDSR